MMKLHGTIGWLVPRKIRWHPSWIFPINVVKSYWQQWVSLALMVPSNALSSCWYCVCCVCFTEWLGIRFGLFGDVSKCRAFLFLELTFLGPKRAPHFERDTCFGFRKKLLTVLLWNLLFLNEVPPTLMTISAARSTSPGIPSKGAQCPASPHGWNEAKLPRTVAWLCLPWSTASTARIQTASCWRPNWRRKLRFARFLVPWVQCSMFWGSVNSWCI